VLEASISSIPDVMREKAPWTRFTPVRFIMRSKFATARYVTNQSTPLFVIHGDSDRTVSFENAERKFSAASQPKQLEIIPGGDHDELDLVDPQRYHLVLEEFLSRHYAL
jgi:hypothetical protein